MHWSRVSGCSEWSLTCHDACAGGALGIQAEACKQIVHRRLEDTFYVVDLGNVLRMYKVIEGGGRPVWGGAGGRRVLHRARAFPFQVPVHTYNAIETLPLW